MAAGKEIKRLRESGIKKISAETLAGYMNVDAAKLRKWEQRDADPKDSGDKKNVETYFGCTLIGLEKLDKFQFYDPKFSKKPSIKTNEELAQMAIVDILIEEVAKLKAKQ